MNASRITKIAGLSLAGFVVASVAADKFDVGPMAAQAAGFAGACVGTLVGRLRAKGKDQGVPVSADKGATKPS